MVQDTTVKTSRYAVIGAPGQLASTLWKQVSTARGAFDDVRDRFTDEAGFAFDQGADEGQRLFRTWGNELSSRRAAVGRALRDKAVRDRTGAFRELDGFPAMADTPAPVVDIAGIVPL